MKLPNFQKTDGDIFSELIASIYQLNGEYVQQNMILKDISEVLEIDILSTKYSENKIKNTLIEAKSGDWGFPDIFKLKGQLDFLGFDEAILTVKGYKSDKNKNDINYSDKATNFYKAKAPEIGVEIKIFGSIDESSFNNIKETFNINNEIMIEDIEFWRHSYRLSSSIIGKKYEKKESYLQYIKNKNQQLKSSSIISDYIDDLNNSIFFLKSNAARLKALYNLHKKNPRLSALVANEFITGIYSENINRINEVMYKEAYSNYKNNIIMLTSYIEYLSKINILKYAVDTIIEMDLLENALKIAIADNDKQSEYRLKFKKTFINSHFVQLPQSIVAGMNKLKSHKYFYLYPVFWQWFLWLFGGFYVEELKAEEFQLLSKKTGIPIDEIENALSAFDIIFPTKDGWFVSVSKFKTLKLFPVCFTGFGILYRVSMYEELFLKNYCKLNIDKSADATIQAINRDWEGNAV